jgi:hypothetical protein
VLSISPGGVIGDGAVCARQSAELRALLPDRLVGDHDATREHHLLDVTEVAREPVSTGTRSDR